VLGSSHTSLLAWNYATLQLEFEFKCSVRDVMRWLPQPRLLALCSDASVVFLDLASRSVQRVLRFTSPVWDVALVGDGLHLAVLEHLSAHISVFCTTTFRPVQQLKRYSSHPSALAACAGVLVAWQISAQDQVQAWNTEPRSSPPTDTLDVDPDTATAIDPATDWKQTQSPAKPKLIPTVASCLGTFEKVLGCSSGWVNHAPTTALVLDMKGGLYLWNPLYHPPGMRPITLNSSLPQNIAYWEATMSRIPVFAGAKLLSRSIWKVYPVHSSLLLVRTHSLKGRGTCLVQLRPCEETDASPPSSSSYSASASASAASAGAAVAHDSQSASATRKPPGAVGHVIEELDLPSGNFAFAIL
jgi:hypothetical protein